MKVTLKTLAKENFDIELEPDSTVLDVKAQIFSIKGAEPDSIKLIYQGQILSDDEKTLEELGFKSDHFMVMMIKRSVVKPVPVPVCVPVPVVPVHASIPVPVPVVESVGLVTVSNGVGNNNHDNTYNNDYEDDGYEDDEENDGNEHENIQLAEDSSLSDTQIQQLYQILNNDPTISQLLTAYPQLREQLTDPQVLLELLRRVGHPIVDQIGEPGSDGNTTVVHVSESEKEDLDTLKYQITEVVGPVSHMTDGQFNAIIYQAYTMADKDMEIAKNFIINEILEGHI